MLAAPLSPVRSAPSSMEKAWITFTVTAGGAVVQASVDGFVISAVRASAGTYTIVVPDQGVYIGHVASIFGVAAGSTIIGGAGTFVSATRTLTINTINCTTAAVVDDTTGRIYIEMNFKPQVSD